MPRFPIVEYSIHPLGGIGRFVSPWNLGVPKVIVFFTNVVIIVVHLELVVQVPVLGPDRYGVLVGLQIHVVRVPNNDGWNNVSEDAFATTLGVHRRAVKELSGGDHGIHSDLVLVLVLDTDGVAAGAQIIEGSQLIP
tara:strand:- start:213 stop:623 length:411 start_codon:yes stop_codon:yes gene_type:complete